MRRLAVVAILLVASLAAGAQEKYVQPQFTNCWSCHAPGVDVPHMDPAYIVVPLAVEAPVGEPFTLRTDLVVTWLAEVRDAYVSLDLREAPSLAFVGAMEPVDRTWQGNITATPGPALLQPQRAVQGMDIPAGATDVRLTIEPAATGTGAPDLTLRVIVDGQDVLSRDEAGPGGAESLHLRTLSEVLALGYGTWEVVAEMTPVRAEGVTPGTSWGYTTRLEAWGNASLETTRVALVAGTTMPGGRAAAQWPLIVQAPPGPDEAIQITANATIHWQHQTYTGDDWENITLSGRTAVRGVPGGAAMGVNTTGTIPVPVQGVSFAAISEAIGYAAAMLLITSMVTGGMLGKASRRRLNVVFGSARRRVAFHNFLSYGIVVAALAHMTIFVIDTIEPDYVWQKGILLGGLGILCMLGLGVTGAMQVPMIRRWDYATWRWVHFGLALATVAFTIAHMLLDGAHFGDVQNAVGWEDPLVPEHRR